MPDLTIRPFTIANYRALHNFALGEFHLGGFPDPKSFPKVLSVSDWMRFWLIRGNAFQQVRVLQSDTFNYDNAINFIRSANQLPQITDGTFIGAIPAHYEAITNNAVTGYDIIFVSADAAEIIEVPFQYDSMEKMLFRVNEHIQHDTDLSSTFVAGFPVFTGEENRNVLAFRRGFVTEIQMPDVILQAQLFRLVGSFLDPNLIHSAINEVVRRFDDPNFLSHEERYALYRTFHRGQGIAIDISTDPLSNGSWNAATNTVFLNMNILQLDFDELCRTLIHELSHAAGGAHEFKDSAWNTYAGCGCTGIRTGVPDDAWEYYNTFPLRAECCIANHTQTYSNK